MNTKDFFRLSVPIGKVKWWATDFVAKFIFGDGGNSRINFQL